MRWWRELPTYGQVSLGEIWPGVSVALRARGSSTEKLFTPWNPGPPSSGSVCASTERTR
jgi:hypothetical protein